jgi:hypothetical protein
VAIQASTGATVPEWLHVFVASQPMAVMNLQITGQYTSPVVAAAADPAFAAAYAEGTADFLPFVPNQAMSTGFVSPFLMSTVNNYRVEYDAELARRRLYPGSPSRLTAIYAFESMADCEVAAHRFEWPIQSVQRFRVEHVLRATRVNMEVVTLARLCYARAMQTQDSVERIWRSYWSGADELTVDLPSVDATQREEHRVGALWEWLIDGTLVHESRAGQETTP